jgi:hypothetical protein
MIRISIVIILVGLATGLVRGQQVIVTPEETDEILANPGMGWQTFHRTRAQDKNLPSWILKELSHPSTAQPGEDIQLAMK